MQTEDGELEVTLRVEGLWQRGEDLRRTGISRDGTASRRQVRISRPLAVDDTAHRYAGEVVGDTDLAVEDL